MFANLWLNYLHLMKLNKSGNYRMSANTLPMCMIYHLARLVSLTLDPNDGGSNVTLYHDALTISVDTLPSTCTPKIGGQSFAGSYPLSAIMRVEALKKFGKPGYAARTSGLTRVASS